MNNNSDSNSKKIFKKGKVWSLLTSIIGLCLIFIGGIFHSSTELERIADYATDIVRKHTNSQKYCCISVAKGDNSGSLPDSTTEFNNLYGAFRQEKITFASAINADKNHDIRLPYGVSDNLSIFYLGPLGTVEYKGHYKHYIYPVELMFEDASTAGISDYKAFISVTHAEKMLEYLNVPKEGEYRREQYETLLGNKISVLVDGVSEDFVVQNIYYQENYYYEGLHEVMGDFVMTSYYLPANLRSEQQNLYFASEYTYQNKYFMEYINNNYSSKSFKVTLNKFNVFGEIDEDYLLSFYYSTVRSTLDWFSVLLFVFAAICLILSLGLFYFSPYSVLLKRKKINYKTIFAINIASLFVPYLIFLLLNIITNNISFLSGISSKFNLIYIISYLFILLSIQFLSSSHKGRTINRSHDDYYEISV